MPSSRPDASRGRLVVLEGIDGAGKSTVADALAQRLTRLGLRVVQTREPTDGPAGRAARAVLKDPHHDPLSEALLFLADHAEHVAWLRGELAQPSTVVISDRYSSSLLAYQGVTLAARWPPQMRVGPRAWLEEVLAPFERAPDLVLLFDIPVEDALARLGGRGRSPEKFERAGVLAQVRDGYLTLARERGWVVLDARRPVAALVADATSHVERLLAGGRAP